MIHLRSATLPLTLLLTVGAINPLLAQSDISVPANGSVLINESGNYQNVTVGAGGNLEIVSGNSGGAGNHSIGVTLAAGAAGTIQDDGLIEFMGTDQTETTTFANPVTISGSGTLSISPNSANVQGPGTVTQAAGHTLIGGGGNANDDGPTFSAPLVNYGLVTTNSNGFILNGTSLVNRGAFSATGGSILRLEAPTLDNTGSTVLAGAGSYVYLNGVTVTGGTLSSVNDTGTDFSNGGFFNNESAATLNNVTLSTGSAFYVSNPITIAGTLTNNGYFFLAGNNFNTGLIGGFTVAADATLAGTGIARLAGGEIDATNNATLTLAAGASIYGGSGTINARLINNGTVESFYQALTINSPTFTNNGLLAASNNASASVSGGTNFTNFDAASQTLTGGTYAVTDQGNGATLDFSGRNVLINQASVTLSGANPSFSALNGLTINSGTLTLLDLKQFSTSAALTNNGAVALDAGTTLHTGGSFAGGAKSMLAITVGGTQSQGTQSPGVLQVNGAATLGGKLVITVGAGAKIAATDTITIMAATGAVGGRFANVPNGERLAAADGTGSFQINYGPDSPFSTSAVVLSDFVASGVVTHPSFFTNEVALSNGVYYLAFSTGNFFGYYSYLSDPHYIYHFDLGYEYVFDAADGYDGVYLYDFKSSTFFYAAPQFPFPYLYDFSLNTVLYYYPDPNTAGHYNTNGVRYFYDFATGKIISK